MSFAWQELLPELRALVRLRLDSPTQHMLCLTCRTESKIGCLDRMFETFWNACAEGHLDICKWIYNLCKNWIFPNDDNDGEEEEGEDPTPYTSLLFYDEALKDGHFDVAAWGKEMGLPIRDWYLDHLALNNHLTGLQWAAANGLGRITRIPVWGSGDMSLIRWLVEECKLLPDSGHIYEAFRCLPGTREKLLYYLSLTPTPPIPEEILPCAFSGGHWECIDFFKEHLPHELARIEREHPRWMECYNERRDVPWRHYMDLKTGEICRNDDDD